MSIYNHYINKIAKRITLIIALLLTLSANAQYGSWSYSGAININTTPGGANLSSTASENDFPLLVKLHKDFFNFSQAKSGGADIRFSSNGNSLAYQIEEWDATAGTAIIWVKVPNIKGNAIQAINIHWGNVGASSESSGSAVFSSSNQFLSVLHLDDATTDEVGTLSPTNVGTTTSAGMIGGSRHFSGNQGIKSNGITTWVKEALPHTTSAWFNTTSTGTRIVSWGQEEQQGKVQMWVNGPPHIRLDGYFSNASTTGTNSFSMNEWVYVSFSYESGNTHLYINGVLDASNTSSGAPLKISNPANFWIGGWNNSFNYNGDIDEVRVSNVARSADWVKMEFENQKPNQTLAGWVVPAGSVFSVTPATAIVNEGDSINFTALAGGALNTVWTIIDGGDSTVLANNRLNVTFDAYRVTADKQVVLRLEALYPTETKSQDIPITIKEKIPEPAFTLTAPANWNGRDVIEIKPTITNQAAMDAAGVGSLDYSWKVSGMAVVKTIAGEKLTLIRSQNSGILTVELTIGNGGAGISQSVKITVNEPTSDPWVMRTPLVNEKPESGQFYARATTGGKCTIHYNGTQGGATNVYLKVFEGTTEVDKSIVATSAGAYLLSVEVDAKLAKYSVEFGTANGNEIPIETVSNLVCGDAYIVQGQSNALANDGADLDHPHTSDWIRTYGSTEGSNQTQARLAQWSNAAAGAYLRDFHIGYWAMEMAKDLVAEFSIPICIINGAKGGTRPDEHMKNYADPTDVSTIYGRLLWRVQEAKLTHGIRGLLWHQGENSQGSVPSGSYGWQVYHEELSQLAADWKTDFPNIKNYYFFQIRPSCGSGGESADMLREVQRTLPNLFSNASIMTTVGIQPPGGCHYPPEGYVMMANQMYPLVARDNYGKVYTESTTPPAIQNAWWDTGNKLSIKLEFDQPVVWENVLKKHFYLDGTSMNIASASTLGNVLTLNLSSSSTAQTIGYLKKDNFGQTDPVLDGENGIAALTFWNFNISSNKTDCNGEVNGTASVDNCNVCSGGNTGIVANSTCILKDCNGDAGGTAFIDGCNICVEGNTGKSKIVNGIPDGYIFLGNEGDTKNLAAKSDVVYGHGCSFTYLYGVSGSIAINNGTFGDPAPGQVKKAYYKTIGVVTSINEQTTGSGLNIYPNPVHGQLNIVGEFSNWTLTDSKGAFIKAGIEKVIEVGSLSPGLYYLNVDGEVMKFIKI